MMPSDHRFFAWFAASVRCERFAARAHRRRFTATVHRDLSAAILLAFCLFRAGSAAAQNASTDEPKIVAVRVVTDSGAVLEENSPPLTIQPGQPFSIESESASLRELFRSGKYADVRAELTDVPGGVRLDYVVRQNLYVNRVQIEGLHEPPNDSVALSALRLNLGEAFHEADMKDAVDRLRQTLEDEGLYQAKVTYELMPHSDTLQMDILVRVVPGPRARLAAVTIVNQTGFPDEELRSRLRLGPGRQITSDRLKHASDRARDWLAKRDYLGARVTLSRGMYDSKTNTVPLEVTLYAGLEVRVTVEGAKISRRTLRRLIPVYQEGAADEDLLQEGRVALRESLERSGYFDAQVNYTTSESPAGESADKKLPAARVVAYHVDRGDRHRLVGVALSGNQYFDSATLKARLKVQAAAYASPGRFSTALLQDDVASIRTLYDANGFHDVQVTSRLFEDYQGHKGDLFIRIAVQEGQQTLVSELSIEGNHELSKEDLANTVGSSVGQPYSDFNVSADRDNLLALYYDQGFPDATFSATVEKAPQAKAEDPPRVRLAYHITEGRQVLVARVLLNGFEHTRPGVISREVAIHAGDPLSEEAEVETQRKLYNLGIFSRVTIAPQNPEGDSPKKAVVIMMDEAKRYTIAYGAGLEAQRLGGTGGAVNGSFTVSPLGIFQISKANLTGRADSLSFTVRASTIQGRALLGYTAPNYFGKPNFSLQLTGFFEKTRNVQTFSAKRYEGSAQLAQKLTITSSLVYRYAYRHVIATQLAIAPEEIPLYSQPTEISEVGISWFRDRRNNPADASRGNYSNVDVDLAAKNIGSSANFLRVLVQNSSYHPIGQRLVFARAFRFGVQTPYGNTVSGDIPLPERFFAGGGTSLRGFGLNQAGPRDPVTGFPVGGQALLVFNQELRFPMHLPVIGNRLGGAVFYDAGNVFTNIRNITLRTSPPVPTFDTNPANPGVCLTNCTNELNYFSHTIGFAFRYLTPIGPVALDIGYQLNPARFVIPITLPNGSTGQGLSRLPSFQFFVNLGATF